MDRVIISVPAEKRVNFPNVGEIGERFSHKRKNRFLNGIVKGTIFVNKDYSDFGSIVLGSLLPALALKARKKNDTAFISNIDAGNVRMVIDTFSSCLDVKTHLPCGWPCRPPRRHGFFA